MNNQTSEMILMAMAVVIGMALLGILIVAFTGAGEALGDGFTGMIKNAFTGKIPTESGN